VPYSSTLCETLPEGLAPVALTADAWAAQVMKWPIKNEQDTTRFDVYIQRYCRRYDFCVAGKVMPYASEDHKAVFYRVKWTMNMNLLQSFKISENYTHTGTYSYVPETWDIPKKASLTHHAPTGEDN
jgi:hypothetical protein